MIRRQTDLTLSNIARMFFTVMDKHFDFLSLVNRHHLLPLFLSKLDEVLPPVFYEVKGKKMTFSKETIQYALMFSTGGFMRILIYWMNEGARKSPEEMAAVVKDLILICNNQVILRQ